MELNRRNIGDCIPTFNIWKMKEIRYCCTIIALGVLLEIGALVNEMCSTHWWWMSIVLAVSGILICGLAITRIVKMYKLTSSCIQLSTENGVEMIPQSCLFSEEINEFCKKCSASMSAISTETAYRSTQLEVLMGQINPHFLYNTLESIRGQALYTGDEIVADMAETLSSFFRYCISRKGAVVCLRDELQNVMIYLKIMEFRFPGKFVFNSQGVEDAVLNYEIPKLTLQPIIENAVLHGIVEYTTGGIINLRVLDTDDGLKIYVRDNGVGISDEKVKRINHRLLNDLDLQTPFHEENEGIALYNINRRIKLTYGSDYGVRIFSTYGTGTNVMIHLPKKRFESN